MTKANHISSNHNTLIILPPRISIESYKKHNKEWLELEQRAYSGLAHGMLFNQLNSLNKENDLSLMVQLPVKTIENLDTLMKKNPNGLSDREAWKNLGSDAVIFSYFKLTDPTIASYSTTPSIRFRSSRKQAVEVELQLWDARSGKMIYLFHHDSWNTLIANTTTQGVMERFIREGLKGMPYFK